MALHEKVGGDGRVTARAAVITDIHANLLALEACLSEIDAAGVDATLCGGDLAGYGRYPNEVCDLIRPRQIPTIYGNYDYATARNLHDCGFPAPSCLYNGHMQVLVSDSAVTCSRRGRSGRSACSW